MEILSIILFILSIILNIMTILSIKESKKPIRDSQWDKDVIVTTRERPIVPINKLKRLEDLILAQELAKKEV